HPAANPRQKLYARLPVMTTAGISCRKKTGPARTQALSDWCGRWDSNPYTLRHYPLKIACLPIPPLPQNCWLNPVSARRPIREPEEPALHPEQVHHRWPERPAGSAVPEPADLRRESRLPCNWRSTPGPARSERIQWPAQLSSG